MTLIEQDLNSRFPEAWLHHVTEMEVARTLTEVDLTPDEPEPEYQAYRMNAQGFPERVERF
jgi:hypothetical protein